MAKENDSSFITLESGENGEVKIADEVVAVIAGYAATEIEGVAAMAGNITSSIMGRVGMKTLSKGVRVTLDGCNAAVNLAIIVRYGHAIPTVSANVQERVKSTIETMTGLKVTDVNVRVAAVDTAAEEGEV